MRVRSPALVILVALFVTLVLTAWGAYIHDSGWAIVGATILLAGVTFVLAFNTERLAKATERAEDLAGEESEWLIPLRGLHDAKAQEPTVTEASDYWLAALKDEVARRSGVRFRGWKTMRATFAQSAIDRGAPIEAVSKAMRHSSTVTTETYYGRIRSSQSFAAIDKAFEVQPVSVKTK